MEQSSRAANHFHRQPKATTAPFPLPYAPPTTTWIVVLDTCAVLEFYESVCGIIHLARQAHQQQQHRQHIAPSDSSVSLAVKVQAVTDPITIVIPYAVWNELDYQSEKKNKNQKYKARRAARMLINELKEQQQQRSVIIGTRSAAVRSQSCKEMNQAVEWFLKSTMTALETKEAVAAAVAAPTAMKIWNDDRILACALYEKDQLLTSKAVNSTDSENSIGSVV